MHNLKLRPLQRSYSMLYILALNIGVDVADLLSNANTVHGNSIDRGERTSKHIIHACIRAHTYVCNLQLLTASPSPTYRNQARVYTYHKKSKRTHECWLGHPPNQKQIPIMYRCRLQFLTGMHTHTHTHSTRQFTQPSPTACRNSLHATHV